METTEPQSTNDEQERPPRLYPRNIPLPSLAYFPDIPLSSAYLLDEEAAEERAPVAVIEERAVASALAREFALPQPSLEMLFWTATVASAVIVRLASLINFPFSAAEGQRAYAAWQFANGQGVRVDGALWGPFPFLVNALFFFLFGARDAIARLGPALAGIALVLVCWSLRPYLGRWGALGVAAMLAVSPTFVYGTRQVTSIPWSLLAALILVACTFRLADPAARSAPPFIIGAVALAALLSAGSAGLTLLLAFVLALATVYACNRPRVRDDDDDRGEEESAISLQRLRENVRALDRPIISVAVVLLLVLLLFAFSLFFADLTHLPQTIISLYGHWWGDLFATQRSEPWYYYLMIAFVYEPFIGTAAIIGLVLLARLPSPRPFVAMLPFVWQIVAFVLLSLSGDKTPETSAMILLPLALIGGIAVEWLAERLYGGWFWRNAGWTISLAAFITVISAVQFLRTLMDISRSAERIATLLVFIALALAAGYVTLTLASRRGSGETTTALLATLLFLCLIIGIRAMAGVTFSRPADGRETLVATRQAADVTPLVRRIRRISIDLTRDDRTYDPATGDRHNIAGGNALAIGVDPSLEWPFRWYFRDFPNFAVADAQTLAAAHPLAADGTAQTRVLLVPSETNPRLGPQLPSFVSQRYPATASYPDRYRTSGAGAILRSLVDPHAWQEYLRYLATRRTAQPPTTRSLTLYANTVIAARVFLAFPPNNLFDRAGTGKAPGQFAAPRGIAVGPDGTITIVDQRNDRVQQFRPGGTFVRQWGGSGAGPDQFGQMNGDALGPTGLAIAPDGTIYVADTWNHRIAAFTSDGTPLRQWGGYFNGQEDPAGLADHTGQFYGPRGIAIGPDGLVYVTDTGNSRIQVFDAMGRFVRAFGSRGTGPGQMDNPVGIAARADGTIAVADTNNARVLLFTADGASLGAVPVPDWATAKGLEAYIGFLPNGDLLIPSPTGNRLTEMTAQGRSVRAFADRDLRTPVAFALAPDGGTAYVVNDANNTVVPVTIR